MSMTTTLINDSLKYYLTGEAVQARPAAWTVALYNALQQEIANGDYARQPVTFEVDAPSGAYTAARATNNELLSFGAASAPYTVSFVGVFADGALIVMQRLVTDKALATGEQAQLAPGELIIGGRI